jgi:hypothetical protein
MTTIAAGFVAPSVRFRGSASWFRLGAERTEQSQRVSRLAIVMRTEVDVVETGDLIPEYAGNRPPARSRPEPILLSLLRQAARAWGGFPEDTAAFTPHWPNAAN